MNRVHPPSRKKQIGQPFGDESLLVNEVDARKRCASFQRRQRRGLSPMLEKPVLWVRMAEVKFHQVESDEDKQHAGALIREYLEWLNDCVQRDYGIEFNVEAMLASDLSDPDKFYPPDGRFYLVQYRGDIAGVGCLKKLEEGVGEIQRMYVPPSFRGKGVGRGILNRLIEDARSIGYRRLKLESLEFLKAAHSLYRSVGFHEVDPYADNSMKSYQDAENLDKYYSITVFMEMNL